MRPHRVTMLVAAPSMTGPPAACKKLLNHHVLFLCFHFKSLELHPHKKLATSIAGTQQGNSYGFGGGFLWVQ